MESAMDWHLARAQLEWQREMGVDECIGEDPVDRFAMAEAAQAEAASRAEARASQPSPQQAGHAPAVVRHEVDAVEVAQAAAEAAHSLEALEQAIAGYDHCELRQGARNTVFCDGLPGSRVMILGEAPGRDEDLQGKPFVGRAGQLLDKMMAAIGLSRAAETADKGVYITNVMPWRPPQNRDPKPEEIAMMMPFVQRHVALAKPEVIILMGNISCQAALNKRGILRLRGHWTQAFGLPAMPMTHPAYLLRQPHAKREAWADLLDIRARLDGEAPDTKE